MNLKKEKVLIVAPRIWKSDKNYNNSIEELSLLIDTLGLKVCGVIEQKLSDSIVTIGGIHGKILQVRNSKATIRVSNNSELTVDVTAVSRLKNSENKE